MVRISGFGVVVEVTDRFGTLMPGEGGSEKVLFFSTATTQKRKPLRDTVNLGEKLGFSGETLEPAQEGCRFIAHYVRKMPEIPEGTGKVENIQKGHGVLCTVETGQRIFFPGKSFIDGSESSKDLTASLKQGDLVDFLAIPNKTKTGAVEMIGIQVSFPKFPALVVYQNSGYSVLWTKAHGKVFCPRNLLADMGKEQVVAPGSWVKCSLESQKPKNGTYWKAIRVGKHRFPPENFVIEIESLNSFSVHGIGLICSVLEQDGFLHSDLIGRIYFKKSAASEKRLTLANFQAKFQLNHQLDRAWVASDVSPFYSDVRIPLSTVKFGRGDVVEVKPDKNYGFIHVPQVGGVYFRRCDYDGQKFDQLKGVMCRVAFVENFEPHKGKSNRALYFVEEVFQ